MHFTTFTLDMLHDTHAALRHAHAKGLHATTIPTDDGGSRKDTSRARPAACRESSGCRSRTTSRPLSGSLAASRSALLAPSGKRNARTTCQAVRISCYAMPALSPFCTVTPFPLTGYAFIPSILWCSQNPLHASPWWQLYTMRSKPGSFKRMGDGNSIYLRKQV